jgi:hypothetical protein
VSATCVPDAATLDAEWASEQETLLAFWNAVAPAAAVPEPEQSDGPKSMEALGLNPASIFDCELYGDYVDAWYEHEVSREIAAEDAALAEADIEAGWLESMAEQEAMIDGAVERGEISEEAGRAAVDEILQEVAAFRVERGYDVQRARPADLAACLRVRAVHAQRGTTRTPRGRRARSPSARSDDDPDHDRLTAPREREVAA